MSYIVNKTDGSILTTILDGTTNTDTGLTLIGRNYTTYGEIQNENFVRLLENFADNIPPGVSVGFAPLNGQLWWDTGNNLLKVYAGGEFIPVSQQTSSTTAPTVKAIGDQWWDKINNQLKIWTGTVWQLIGPIYTTAQGKSGTFVETVDDADGNPRQVVTVYTKGALVGIISNESFAISANLATIGYSTITTGFNIPAGEKFNGTAADTVLVGGLNPSLFARRDQQNTFTSSARYNGGLVTVAENSLGDGVDIAVDKHLTIRNNTYGANVYFAVKGALGTISPLAIEANTGAIIASATPTSDHSLTNKIYVDNRINYLQSELDSVNSEVLAAVQQVFTDYVSNISSVVNSTNSNLNSTATGINGNVTNLNTQVNNGFQAANVQLTSLQGQITSITNFLPSLAPLASPSLSGVPTSITATAGNNSNMISTTAFVSLAASNLTNDYNTKIDALRDNLTSTITNGLATKAPTASPALSGTPTAPTATTGTNTTQIATTAFVTQSINAQKFRYAVGTAAPSGGQDGDFYFQIG